MVRRKHGTSAISKRRAQHRREEKMLLPQQMPTRRRGPQLRRRATVLGLGSVRVDHLAASAAVATTRGLAKIRPGR
jgi:hypothetical protein